MSSRRWVIKNAISNNMVCARNERNQERILVGKGIGFKAKSGDEIDASRVEKEYFLKSKNITGKLYALLAQTPEVYMEIADEIVKRAQKALGSELDEALFLHLIDHISFAVSRMEQGLEFKNVLLLEIRNFYPREFEVAKDALSLIEEKTKAALPEDEAASIAMHIVNAEFNYQDINASVRMTELIHKIISIVRYQYQMNFDEESVHYIRFVTHLKFFAQRLFGDTMLDGNDLDFQKLIRTQYKESYACAEKIAKAIWDDYQIAVSEEELIYLTVYIRRITTVGDEE
ncbi:MAG: PRD domain-containing protein [Lachnospiraceae bacterium]|nr:PRD domain-containing protein [Lachnospiraceae bacterium]